MNNGKKSVIVLVFMSLLLAVMSCAPSIDSTKNHSADDKKSLQRRQNKNLTKTVHKGPSKLAVWWQRKQMLRKKDRNTKK